MGPHCELLQIEAMQVQSSLSHLGLAFLILLLLLLLQFSFRLGNHFIVILVGAGAERDFFQRSV